MTSYFFLFDTVRVPVFCLSENRTENRFQTPVRSVNRVPVHERADVTETRWTMIRTALIKVSALLSLNEEHY